ncbi:TfuA-like protein [Streptomyces natalensis]|uniref:TfuA-like protein n=1 Tax=Streptomyces natalensis TaxID=68242 RepID=UPI0004AADBEE|nr:TfuA-like protein [Streptomyces natalensis]
MIHAFTGPTLSPDDPALSHERFTVRPPIQHGDLFDPQIMEGDTVVIIDGLYHHTPALRHKEIIRAMSQGIRVIGAASIGALRAAELAPCGMVGVGEIFHAYATGAIEGDDEVAVAQSADTDARSYTWPLVNVRHVLHQGVRAQVIDEFTADMMLTGLRDVYYAHRSLTALRIYSRQCGANGFAAWLTERLAADPHFGDLKRADALKALKAALSLDGTPVTRVPDVEWRTRCSRQWANAFAAQTIDGLTLSTRHRVAYQQIFDPHFKAVWSTHLKESGAGEELPHLLACAAYRSEIDLTDPGTVDRLLAHETSHDRAAVAQYAALNDLAVQAQPGFFVEAIKDSVARRLLTRVWQLPGDALENEAWTRGFQGARDAAETAKWFVVGFLKETETVQ